MRNVIGFGKVNADLVVYSTFVIHLLGKKYTMRKISFMIILSVVGLWIDGVRAQEFPIAVGPDTTFSGGAVYGGGNGIVAVQGNSFSRYTINAQIVRHPGTRVGERISIPMGTTPAMGIVPGAIPVFDGDHYFLVWCGFDSTLWGQFISTSGIVEGIPFPIARGVSLERNNLFKLAVDGVTILIIYVKHDDGCVYGRFVSQVQACVVRDELKISQTPARELAIAFDGSNYLIAWVEQIPHQSDKNIYGQFVSRGGDLIGSNFVIDDGPYYSDNPISMAFDGSRYLLAYHETSNSSGDFVQWRLDGRFITKSGEVSAPFTLCDSTVFPFHPSLAFDGTNYLVTWTQFADSTLRGQFLRPDGVLLGEPFVLFSSENGKIPVGGIGYGGQYYLAVATKVDRNFTDGDVYGYFLSPLTSIDQIREYTPGTFALFQNYPNPFNPTTTIRFTLAERGWTTLKVYDILGREVITLIDEELDANKIHEVVFDASNLASGCYVYRLQSKQWVQVKQLLLVR